MANVQRLSGRRKAAIFIVSLGPDRGAKIIKHLKDEETEIVSFEISRLTSISNEERHSVLKDFYELLTASKYLIYGGIGYASDVLEKSLGADKANEIISRLTSSLQIKPFSFINNTDAQNLVSLLQSEHPQTTALVLAYLDPKKSSDVLMQLPVEMQTDVAKRIAKMDRTTPDVIREVENILERKLSSFDSEDFNLSGGVDITANILNLVDRSTEKTIIENLEEDDPELAEEIKKRMFVFDDIIILDDRSVQKVLRKVEYMDILKALKSVDEEVKEKFLRNMSTRAAAALQEDIDFLGPTRISDVEEAQQRIISVVRKLEEEGELVIVRAGEKAMVV